MGVSFWQLLIIFGIVLILFGGKKLRNLGSDLGTAIKGFRTAVSEDDKESAAKPETSKETTAANAIESDGQTRSVDAEVLRQKDKDRA